MTDARLRRLAIQIAGQLPPSVGDAHAVLRLVREVVDGFMMPPSAPKLGVGAVLVLSRPQGTIGSSKPVPEVPAVDAPEIPKPEPIGR